MTEKFSFLFSYLKKESIYIDEAEFDFQVQSHPDYPSLLAISETLTFLNVDNVVAKVLVNELENLPYNFVALIGEEKSKSFLSFVERKKDGYKYHKEGKIRDTSNEEFYSVYKSIVLLAEQRETSQTKGKFKGTQYFANILLAVLFLSCVFISGSHWLSFPFISLSSAGVYLSMEAIKLELGVGTKLSKAFCTITADTECGTIKNGKKSGFFEIFSFTDLSITFFVAQFIGLLFFSMAHEMTAFYNLTFVSLVFSIPVTFVSLYQQKFVAKKWCPICLSIIIVLYAEMVSIFDQISLNFTLLQAIYFSIAFILSYVLCFNVKNLIKANFDLKSQLMESNRFRRNYGLFKLALLASKKYSIEKLDSGNLILGNPDANLKILVVTNPFCGHCKNAHSVIEEILKLHKDEVAIHIRFNINFERASEKSKMIHRKLVQIYFEKGEDEFIKALRIWFDEKDIAKLDPTLLTQSEVNIESILGEQYSWNNVNNINFTPAVVINDYLFPSAYDRKYLPVFINELKNDAFFHIENKPVFTSV